MTQYQALVAQRLADGSVGLDWQTRLVEPLPSGYVRVRVTYSSINYKDALACTGHPGVARRLPLVPGIDAVGVVIESTTARFRVGEAVMVFHAQFGTEVDGGYSELIAVPEGWVYPLPEALSPIDAMTIGTGGFTAAQSVDAILRHGVRPEAGEVVVSGATGGVGIFAVMLLAKLGFTVVASSGKPDRVGWLHALGAQTVIDRDALRDDPSKPLLSARWAAAVDTVGGVCLSTILRSTKPHHCVTACGLVGGADVPLTVYPFILRGVALYGIDTATISPDYRSELWQRLSTTWRFTESELLQVRQVITRNQLQEQVQRILAGGVAGRVVVSIAE